MSSLDKQKKNTHENKEKMRERAREMQLIGQKKSSKCAS